MAARLDALKLMATVIFTASASADLDDIILDLTHRAGETTARRDVADFEAHFDRLAGFPRDRRAAASPARLVRKQQAMGPVKIQTQSLEIF